MSPVRRAEPPPTLGADSAPAPSAAQDTRTTHDTPAPRAAAASTSLNCLLLLRPHQWIKNLVVLLVPMLQHALPGPGEAGTALLAVALFVMASAGTYVVNDVVDRHRDRLHPVKRLRPVASGSVPVPLALTLGALLYGGLLAGLVPHAWQLSAPVLGYAALNVLYSFALKHVPLIDVFVIAGGFVLRAWAGAVAVSAHPSPWLYVSLFSACVLLGFGKRRHELTLGAQQYREPGKGGPAHRPALQGYSVTFVDSMLTFAGVLCVLAYLLFLNSGDEPGAAGIRVLVFAPLAMFAVARYLQLLLVSGSGGDPARTLLTDRWMVGTALVWLATTAGLAAAAPS